MITIEIPSAPRNASPVPHLTSIHSSVIRGSYGSSRYPGNCDGNIIKDLLLYFQPQNVFDPMTGSGTCQDVCQELQIPCDSQDISQGFDAASKDGYQTDHRYDFIWLHPPYWRMKLYTDDSHDLSNASTLQEFDQALQQLIANCRQVLSPRGRLAILMGDYFDKQAGQMIPCTHLTRKACFQQELWPACTEIIRLSHRASSSRKTYSSSFIPGLHDTCSIWKKKRK